MKQFKVYVKGIKPGANPKNIVKIISREFNIPLETVVINLKSKNWLIKKTDNQNQANKYKNGFERIGCIVEINEEASDYNIEAPFINNDLGRNESKAIEKHLEANNKRTRHLSIKTAAIIIVISIAFLLTGVFHNMDFSRIDRNNTIDELSNQTNNEKKHANNPDLKTNNRQITNLSNYVKVIKNNNDTYSVRLSLPDSKPRDFEIQAESQESAQNRFFMIDDLIVLRNGIGQHISEIVLIDKFGAIYEGKSFNIQSGAPVGSLIHENILGPEEVSISIIGYSGLEDGTANITSNVFYNLNNYT